MVGSWQDDDAGSNSGSIYFFRKTSDYFGNGIEDWEYHSRFTGWDASDALGMSLQVTDNGIATAGAPGGSNNRNEYGTGYVLIFSLQVRVPTGFQWVESHILEAADGDSNDFFGMSLSIHGRTIVVGAYGYDKNGRNRVRAAYVYELHHARYTQSQISLPDYIKAADEFGKTIWENTTTREEIPFDARFQDTITE